MKCISKLEGGGSHPGTGALLPPSGESFEVDEATGAALIAAGLAGVKAAKAAKAADTKGDEDGER